MSTFADFALLAAVPSYGGAEILRAQRVLPMGPGPRVHLALFGRNDAVMRRVVAAANAGAAILHPAIARIYEVARYDGVVYAVGDPSEGLDLAALMGGRKGVPLELGLAVVASLARVAVAIHDAGGPGYRGPHLGLGAVLSGGLTLDTVFLETNGAVRIRPLAAAGNDPDAPSSFRAPEAQISMAADVYALGRVLMALLSGDGSGRTIPRLPSTSSLPQLLGRLIHKNAAERLHLHDAVTRLEQALREQGASSGDQVIRTALAGPLRPLVIDPGFGLDAPPRVVDALRMQLAWIYPAIERLWPTMTPSMAPSMPPPPPLALAALPPSTSEEGNAVFTDARPARRQQAQTATTSLFNEARGALPAPVSEEGGAFEPKTSPTLIIPTADLARAMSPTPSAEDDPDERPEKTKIIDQANFRPFAPPPPPPLGVARPAPVPTPPPVVTPPPARDRVFTASVHMDSAGEVDPSLEDAEESTQLPPEEAAVILVQRRSDPLGGVADAAVIAEAFASAFKSGDDDDVFADDGAFSPSVAPTATAVAPPPALSEPGGGVTDAIVAVANASTALAALRGDATDSIGALRAADPSLGAFGSTVGQFVDDGLDSIEDPADFVMVGEAGRTFDDEKNPFKASTRMIPAQAMLRAMDRHVNDSDEQDALEVDDAAVDEGVFSQQGPARAPPAATLSDDDVRTEMVSADHVASMLRVIGAAPASTSLSAEGPAQNEPPRPRAVSGLSTEGRRLATPSTPRASVPDGEPLSQLVIDAPPGASVSVNGTVVGTGPTTMDVGATSRCVVKVTQAGHMPFSTVVMVQGRPRVRVKPALKAR